MINTNLIIWSKDRACQLHLLLESLNRFWISIDKIYIITKSSNDNFYNGYDKLFSHIKNFNNLNISMIEEKSFYKDTSTLINLITNKGNYISFSTDDTVLFREVDLSNLNEIKLGECFSLRLGLNTIVQNHFTGEIQPSLNRYSRNDNIISWATKDYHCQSNYGYPFSLDMHIFNSTQLSNLIDFEFKNTNQLEGNLCHKYSNMNFMMSFEHSCAVNIPLNNMSSITESSSSKKYTVENLNKEYLNGKILSLESILSSKKKIVGAHQHVELELVNHG